MKNFLLFALLLTCISGFAQCNLDLSLTSNKTEYFDGSGALQRSVDESSTIEIIKKQVLINPGNSGNIMTATITSYTCEWPTAYKEGKSVIKADFDDPSGNTRHATMTLEGKDGKVTFTMEIAEMADRVIKVTIDTFKEKK
ncbi:hypothetical protein [Emticicia agri]|uniref:Lipocalin-like domain-containing protein n=1 Tax=Emticicia agri TaxID=2492393 RepID=A0A4Q5LVA2_9BACT|nr:hypothetical protein [Emticicia agri]RYU93383.1 hypothetical protein EWM59_22235 [Emticicia agri]